MYTYSITQRPLQRSSNRPCIRDSGGIAGKKAHSTTSDRLEGRRVAYRTKYTSHLHISAESDVGRRLPCKKFDQRIGSRYRMSLAKSLTGSYAFGWQISKWMMQAIPSCVGGAKLIGSQEQSAERGLGRWRCVANNVPWLVASLSHSCITIIYAVPPATHQYELGSSGTYLVERPVVELGFCCMIGGPCRTRRSEWIGKQRRRDRLFFLTATQSPSVYFDTYIC